MTRVPNEFRFESGRLALDLPATVRRRASDYEDTLKASGASARWLRDAGLVKNALDLSESERREIIELREAIWIIFDALLMDRPLSSAAVDIVNQAASHQLAIPQLDASSTTVRVIADDPFRTALAVIARDAIDLIGSPLRERIKACAQEDCRMLFLDASRSSRRRWCSMDRCGSRAKGETFRSRHRGRDLSSND
jgi:predicted RNA-binding Zn ribbon-like protein